jgi:REP element-mobilizing transposase RayT
MNKFRKIIRLPDYDYSKDGAYFVTIVTHQRTCLFGNVIDQEMVLNGAGEMINQVCREITNVIPSLYLDIFQIMPNHFHGIFVIEKPIVVGAGLRACPGRPRRVAPTQNDVSLFEIVGRFKSLTTNRYIQGVKEFNWPIFETRLWQQNYYEHIIRNERDYQAVADYIFCNPQNWEKDTEYPF